MVVTGLWDLACHCRVTFGSDEYDRNWNGPNDSFHLLRLHECSSL